MIAMRCAKAIAGPVATVSLICIAALAQQRQYTDQDYANAEKFMAYNVNPLAYKGQVNAQWLDDDRFWYREVDESGTSYVMVDPAKGSREPLFDQEKLATALKVVAKGGPGLDARHLPLSDISLSDDDHTLTFTMHGATYQCTLDARSDACKVISGGMPAPGQSPLPPMTLSPNQKLGAFIRDWNLWVRDVATGARRS